MVGWLEFCASFMRTSLCISVLESFEPSLHPGRRNVSTRPCACLFASALYGEGKRIGEEKFRPTRGKEMRSSTGNGRNTLTLV